MGAFVLAVTITLAGAAAGAFVALRAAHALAGDRRTDIARWTVTTLGGATGAIIASQVYNVVHQIQRANEPLYRAVSARADALALVSAFRAILLYGGALIALAAIVGLVAARRPTEVSS